MHTLPAAKVVGHDFLGNHIGQLLIRQPVKRTAPAPRNKTSSNGSTVCGGDDKTVRRASVVSLEPASTASSASNTSDVQSATAALDSFLNVGPITPLGTSADPVASLENSSESSASEPSSVDSRSGSADAELHLNFDQLSLSHKRLASEGVPKSPRVSFVTNFGARPQRSGSRRAPSEAGSSSYFGMSSAMSSHMSSASLSPMEPSGGISWNLPFREQHPSFAQAVEHNASLNRNRSQQSSSSSSGAASSSQPSKPSTPPSGLDAEAVTPTTASGGEAASSAKSQSFSAVASTQPVRQRLTRAATESTLNPAAQMQQQQKQQQKQQQQQPLKSPGASSGLSHSNSMGATTSALRTHRKKPSLVPKGDDERTFCFVDASSSDAEFDEPLVEEPSEAANTTVTLPLARSASDSSYKDVVDVQYGAHTRASSEQSKASKNVADAMQSATSTPTIEAPRASGLAMAADTLVDEAQQNDTLRISQPVVRDQDTRQHSSVFPIKPLSSASQTGVSRPARRLRIQPNVQSRPSLLEKTMEEQRRASRQAKTASASVVPAESESPAVTPSASEKVPESPGAKAALADRYDPIAYGAGQRTFRIQSPAAAAGGGGFDFPFTTISYDGRDKAGERDNPRASHARTSDWARAQRLLASSPPAHELSSRTSQSGYVDMRASCHSMSGFDDIVSSSSSSVTPPPPCTALVRHHTASYSSESTQSPSILDTRELVFSPTETAISTPELESPPGHALDSVEKAGVGVGRRSSPLSS
ncbi:uncharacterized protein UTRI_00337_B [Ustilago trichophora]|uniref:Uncharacterized protein n=1 Tax=Ustilago trichophora TaxID=86804 RepID=A0A5C3DRX3_9BASI|nr:uncharacterized protein UTRI_00337_B [Ustilago trichophora]